MCHANYHRDYPKKKSLNVPFRLSMPLELFDCDLFFRNKKETDTAAQYKSRFSVHKFLEVFPDPERTFTNPERKLALNDESPENDINYALVFLQNQYPFARKKCIEVLFPKNKNLVEVCARLDKLGRTIRLPRDLIGSEDTSNIELLQVVSRCCLITPII